MKNLVVSRTNSQGLFNQYILRRIKKNKNFVCCITGGTGSGKSYSAIREGERLDPNFGVDNICLTQREFMELVNGKTKELKKGSVIVYDEVQVSMSHLEYQSLQSRLINYCMQTFRHKNFILFMTSPHFSFINASLRKLFHSRWETVGINAQRKICTLKPFLIQINQKTGDVYEKYLRGWTEEQGIFPIEKIECSIPTKTLVKEYEAKKTEWTTKLNERIERDLEKIEGKGDKKEIKTLTTQQERIFELGNGKSTMREIASELDVSLQYIYAQRSLMRKKGFDFETKKGNKVEEYYKKQGFS